MTSETRTGPIQKGIDHDQFFKAILHTFLPEFLTLFYPAEAAQLQLDEVHWLEQEQFLNVPAGDRKEVETASE